jgi:glycosyltransferase involved in cell wall biosynthesis
VLNQTYSNIEHIIVEDRTHGASTLVEDVIRIYGANLKYFRSEKGGRTAAGNTGLKHASGELIMFLDDDDLLFADHVETLVESLIGRPDCIAAYTLAWQTKSDIDYSLERYSEISHEVLPAYRRPFDRRRLLTENIAPIQAVLFRRYAFEARGGLREDLDLLEDWNLFCRYSTLGDFLHVPKLTSLYRVPSDPSAWAARQRALDGVYEQVRDRNIEELLSTYSTPLSLD